MSNAINPEHYNRLNPQPKDVIRAWDLNFNLGSAVKYVSRAGHKDDIVQDLKKAQEFIQFEIDAIEKERAGRVKPKKVNDIKIDKVPLLHSEGELLRIAVPVGMDPETVIKRVISQIYGGK